MKRTAIILLLSVILSGNVVHAADGFERWDEETKRNAWDVYVVTEWTKLGNRLMFGRVSGEIHADVSAAARNYETLVIEVLESMDGGVYDSKDYVELMLAILDVIGNPSDYSDPYQINRWFNPERETNQEDSIRYVAQRLFAAESAYFDAYGEVSPYTNNGALQSVIQGIMYGTQYTRENQEYTQESSQSWYDAHHQEYIDSGVEKDPFFAKKVSDLYTTVGVTGSYNGTVTEEMQRIVDIASSHGVSGTSGMCAEWVTRVYQAAGASTIPWGNAIDMWNQYSSTGSTSMSNIPPGAIVCGSGVGADGAQYGHVGIYIGNGQVASQNDVYEIETLEQWCSWQTANCQGHVGWIGWVYPGGVPE
ncbi:hypothetical protein LKD70_16355 [Ruminococcus sp. CLA-AA-H200]|uniref:CHAP domain-containing protein n=1 Tax=Ruminococcus turbiniformis TaxID=2881258 RepID=A0ABS8G0Y4_9FIRM|nr:hypothetical protein [Ruminococcus turbiniformis]MCC2255965.1 hypothetical protein [Ruminococcus turbiniformis]